MILAQSGAFGRAQAELAVPQPDGTVLKRTEEVVGIRLGLGMAGELEIAIPLELAKELGQGMIDMAGSRLAVARTIPPLNGQ